MATVLILEEDRDIREVLRMILEEEGYDVLEARPCAAQAALYSALQPCVVLADPGRPDAEAAFLRTLTYEAGQVPRHRFVLLSACPADIDAEWSPVLSALSACVLPKPFELDALLQAVAQKAELLHGRASGAAEVELRLFRAV
jgi:DNA-binding NtrC family response regulator